MGNTNTDVVIVGTGIAGLTMALDLAPHCRVTVLSKRQRDAGNTHWAQGGIAAAWAGEDSWQDHVQDTLVAGAGLCRREVVEAIVRDGRQRIQELIDRGVAFDRREGHPEEYDLHIEGGHSTRRVLHAKDATGAEIVRALLAAVEAHPNIEVRERWMAVDVITERWRMRRSGGLPPERDRAIGLYVLELDSGEVHTIGARAVAICSGGAGKVYLYTSNPDIATGDGIAMAWRAGLRNRQHGVRAVPPDLPLPPEAKSFLISEAVRGEGRHPAARGKPS
jgi:L-aspartate oxidase